MTIKTIEKAYKNEYGNSDEVGNKRHRVRHEVDEFKPRVFKEREDILVAMSKAHRPAGARRETFLGKRGTQVSGPSNAQILDTNGSSICRSLPDNVKKLIYRIFYSDQLIRQRLYFDKSSAPSLITKNLSKIDSFTLSHRSRSGMEASRFPCVASVNELVFLYTWYVTKAAFLPGDTLEESKPKIISLINDPVFQLEYKTRYSTRTNFKRIPIPSRTVMVAVEPVVKESKKTSFKDWMNGFGNKKVVKQMSNMTLSSQLNGSHGEFTESDDVKDSQIPTLRKAPGPKVDAGVAPVVQATGVMKSVKDTPKVECSFHQKGTCKRGDKCKFAHSLVDVDLSKKEPAKDTEKPKNQLLVVKQPDQVIGWNGKKVLEYSGNGKFQCREGSLFDSVDEDVIVENVVEHGFGWVVVSPDKSKGQTVKCCGAIIRYCNTSTTIRIDTSTDIFKPLFNQLLDTVTTSHRAKSSSIEASKAIASRFYPGLPQRLVVDTIAAHAHNNEITSALLDRTLCQMDLNTTSFMSELGVEQNRDSFWREFGTIPEGIDFNWEIRDDAVILPNSTGVVWHEGTNKGVKDGKAVYAGFLSEGEECSKYFLTCMVRFVATHKNRFTIYEINGANVKFALKRVLGCNTNNGMYRACQYFMADAYSRKENVIPGTFLSEDLLAKFYKTARVKRFVDGDEVDRYTVGNNAHNHIVDVDECSMYRQYAMLVWGLSFEAMEMLSSEGDMLAVLYSVHKEVRTNVTRGRTRFHLRLDPGVIQNTLDTVVGLKDYLYRGSLLGYYQYLEPMYSREYSANLPHIKRELRQRYYNGVELHLDKDCLVKKVSLKLKREIAKFGKVGRFYATYDAGAIYAPELPDIVKTCIHGEYTWIGEHVTMTVVIMSKCSGEDLDNMFRVMLANINRPNHLYYVVYSDDSCLFGTYNGIRVIANSDIVSCDTSNRWPVFLGVYSLICDIAPERALGLVEQCTKPMEAVNPSNDEEKMKIFMHSTFEGSGTVLTTLLNHTINNDIGVSLFTVLNRFPGIDLKDAVKIASTLVGHKVTLDFFEDIEKLQFLKRSPMLCRREVDGTVVEEFVMCLNMGTVLRSLGTLEGDMNARQLNLSNKEFIEMSWQDRMDEYLSAVILGLVHEPHNPILDALRARFCKDFSGRVVTQEHNKILAKFTEVVSARVNNDWVVDSNSFNVRYSLNDFQLETLVSQIAASKLGATYASKACASIFASDYGVEDISVVVV